MLETLKRRYKRAADSPVKGQITLSDDSETTVLDVGTLDGPNAYRLHTALLNISLGSHANVTVRLKADVNGSLETIESNQYSSGQITGLFGDINPDRITAPRVVLTVEGSNASPSTNGTVDYTIEYTTAT